MRGWILREQESALKSCAASCSKMPAWLQSQVQLLEQRGRTSSGSRLRLRRRRCRKRSSAFKKCRAHGREQRLFVKDRAVHVFEGDSMSVRGCVSVLCLVLTLPVLAVAQARPFPGPGVQQIYQRLLPQIEKIPAFDHHAHPGYADDPDVDAMAAPPNASEALRTRDDNPELVIAARSLFGYPYNDFSRDHAKWLIDKKAELKKQLVGTAYFDSILDKLNTESSVANRAVMPDYLDPKRFPWVFFADSFMWPFNNERESGRNPDEGVFIPLQEKMLHRWMQQENVSKLPAGFGDYLKFITQALVDNQKKGGIDMKF